MTGQTPRTICDLLAQAAIRYGPRRAIGSVDGLRTFAMSYADLWQASEAAAMSLIYVQGLRRGDCVLLWAPSGSRMVATFFGLLRAGLVPVPLDQNSTREFVESVYRKTDARALILPQAAFAPTGVHRIAIETIELAPNRHGNLPMPGPADVAEIVFTSGTTGDPKGVVLTHANIIADVVASSAIVPAGVDLDLLSILPLSHMFEQSIGLILPLYKGGSVHFVPSLRPSTILREMCRRRVRGMVVVPRFLQLLMTAVEQRMQDRHLGWLWRWQNWLAARLPLHLRRLVFFPQLRGLGGRLEFFMCGGAALPAALMQAWERMGVRIIEGYGATECAPVIASNTFEDRVAGSVGFPIAGVETRVSEAGELLVKGGNVFSGYWRNAALTEQVFTSDGWFRTGDLVETTDEGRLKIVARLSDRIVLSSGMKVYPEDVEAALAVHPAVRDCVVLGIADSSGQDRVQAVIRPAEGADAAAVAKAVEAANQVLASHQRILGFTLWQDAFPRTALQKVRRAHLRNLLEGQAQTTAPAAPVDPIGQAGRLLRTIAKDYSGEITALTRLDADLQLDSLARVELAVLIERETGQDLAEEKLNAAETAGDLAALLEMSSVQAEPMSFPRWPRNPLVGWGRTLLQGSMLFPFHRFYSRPFKVEGVDNVARVTAPCLFVANHASHADTVAILRALPRALRRRTTVAAAADYFFASRLRSLLAGLLLNAFPFSRQGRIRESLEHCGLLCDDGWSILIFPEGTRSVDGRLLPFKSGIGLLSNGLKVQVVPISVTGGASVLPKGASWPRHAAMSVRFGQPQTIPAGMSVEDTTALLHAAVAKGLPQDLMPGG